MIEIDGTFGEGGGQILRTSLALAAVTGQAFRISRIRGRRAKPGLRRQHLTAVRAAQQVAAAEVHGAQLESTQLTFAPATVVPGRHRFDIGTAGSTLLVVQTLLPILFRADQPSTITVIGGTHNPMSPPFEFFNETFLPAIRRLGFRASAQLVRPGFFPAGGGEVGVTLQPLGQPQPVDFAAVSEAPRLAARVLLSQLPDRIWDAERAALDATGLPLAAIARHDVTGAKGPGNAVFIDVERPGSAEPRRLVCAAIGERRKSSRVVVDEAATLAREVIETGGAVDRHLADQILIYLALAGGGSLTTSAPTLHTTTNMAVIERFLPVRFEDETIGSLHRIRCVRS